MKKVIVAAVGAALCGVVSARETFKEDFGGEGRAVGVGSCHYEAGELVGVNAGTILFDVMFAEGLPPVDTCRTVMALRTGSRTRLTFYTCDANKTLLCALTDNDGEHTWLVTVPEIPFGRRVQLGVTWDGTVVRGYLNGRVFASGVQPIPVEKVTQLHFGPYRDNWMGGAPWADDVRLFGVRVWDEALSPETIATGLGLAIQPLETASPMVLTIPAVPQGVAAPTVDGRADDAAWKFAASLPQLIMGNFPGKSGQIPEHGFKLLYDKDNLYLTFRSRFPGNVPIIEGEDRTSSREPALWGTESFEFRFMAGGHLYCFGGNVAGGFSEGRDEDYSWNGAWTYKVSKSMNIDDTILWRGEVAIPWSSLGLSAPPQELPLNFGRSWKLPSIGCHTSLHLQGGGYADVPRFVKAKLAAAAPAYELIERTNPSEGTYCEKFALVSRSAACVEYEIALASLDGTLPPMTGVKRTYDLKAGEPLTDTMEFATGIPGYDALVHTLKRGEEVVLRETVPYALDEKFFSVVPLLLHEKIRVCIKPVMLKLKHGADFKGEIQLKDAAGEVRGSWALVGDRMEVPFALANPTGDYTVVLADARTGKPVDSSVVKFPGVGDWARQDFHPERIIPPFKPLSTTVEEGTCDVIKTAFSDRCYGWKESLFLTAAISKGKKVLSSPVEVLVDGTPLKARTFKVGMNKPHRMEFSGTAENAELSGWLEYDGVNYNKLKVKAPGKALSIRFKMPSDCVTFLHGARGGAWGLKITDCVKSGRSTLRYYPVMWLCNQERGFCFFTETRQGWNADEKACFSFDKGPQETVVTVAVMDSLPQDAFEFEFGIQATPMRPLARNHPYETYGSTQAQNLNRPGRIPTTCIAAIADDRWKYGDTASFFGDLDTDSGRKTDFAMSRMFELCHGHPEVRPVPYTCARWLSTKYPEVAAYLNEWKFVPELALDNEGTGHFQYDMCPTTKASDYYMWRFRKMLERHPEQRGIYCDFGTVKECSNEDHGCHGHIPLLAFREFVRRLAVVQTDYYKEDPIVVLHNTDCNQIPCLSFATHLFNGEQVRQASTAMLHNKRDILDNYGLDMFGCELSTLPMGVCNGPYFPFDRLTEKNGGDEEDAPYKFRMDKAAFAGCLAHDHFPSQARGHFGIYDKVYRVYEDFGVGKTAKFIGYWRNPAKVMGGTNVYVSCYTDGKKVLAVVSHIGKEHEDKDVEITFDAEVLGLSEPLRNAVDTMTRPDPDYDWLFEQAKRHNVPPWRVPLIIGEFGTRVDGFDGKTLKYHLPYHTYGIVELVP